MCGGSCSDTKWAHLLGPQTLGFVGGCMAEGGPGGAFCIIGAGTLVAGISGQCLGP